MIEIIPNWHPIVVHFTIGLLGISVIMLLAVTLITQPLLRNQLGSSPAFFPGHRSATQESRKKGFDTQEYMHILAALKAT